MGRTLAGIASLALLLSVGLPEARAGDGEVSRADLAERVARCERTLFRGAEGLPGAPLLEAVDREYGRCSIDWSLGRGRAAGEDLARAAALAEGVTCGAEVALSSALEVRVEPRVAPAPAVFSVRLRALYLPEGLPPSALVVAHATFETRDGDVGRTSAARRLALRAGDLCGEGVRLRFDLRHEPAPAPEGRMLTLQAWAALAPAGAQYQAGEEADHIIDVAPPRDAFVAQAYAEVVPDAGARLARARARIALPSGDPDPREATREWTARRLASALGQPAPDGPPVLGPVAFGAELTRLERELAGEPPATPPPLLTVEALRDARGALAPYTLYVPGSAREAIDAGRPVPLVLALHGIGDDEWTFLEAYGGGRIQRLVEARGWALACPREGDTGRGERAPGAGPEELPLACVEAAARRIPVDRARVFVVGHSMGAWIAAETLAARPGAFRAGALVGGAAPLASEEALARTPLLVAWGARDPLSFGSRLLALDLARRRPARLETLEVPAAGHVMSVARSLDRAFALFDEVSATASSRTRR